MTVSHKITVVDTLDGLTELKEDWDRLHQMGKPDPFRSYAWVRSWLRHFGDKGKWQVLLAKEHGQVIWIAPIMLTRYRRYGLPARKVGFLDDERAGTARGGVVSRIGAVAAIGGVLEHLSNIRREWDFAEFNGISAELLTDEKRQIALKERGFRQGACEITEVARVLPIDKDWAGYLKDQSRNFRGRLVTEHNRLARIGDVRLLTVPRLKKDLMQQLDRVLPIVFGSLGAESVEQLTPDDARVVEFLTDLVESTADSGVIDLRILEVDQCPIACLLSIIDRKSIFPYLSKYDAAFARYSPGRAIISKLVEHAFEEGFSEIDFMSNWPHLQRYTDLTHTYYKFRFFHDGLYSRSMAFAQEFIAPAVRRLRRTGD